MTAINPKKQYSQKKEEEGRSKESKGKEATCIAKRKCGRGLGIRRRLKDTKTISE